MRTATLRENCCGCTACEYVCPVNAITMADDEKGFRVPEIDPDKCTGCELCAKSCGFKARLKDKMIPRNGVRVFAVKKKSSREESQSGGAFAAFADYALKNGYVVYGVVCEEDSAFYFRTESVEGLQRMKGSKYVQADVRNIFGLVMNDISNGRHVMFSGTPCHVDGLYSVLEAKKIPFEGLLVTVDLVCHGTVSPGVFRDYYAWLVRKFQSIYSFNFRYKMIRGGAWHSHMESFLSKKFFGTLRYFSSNYTNIFYSHKCLRESCYSCPYASINRRADITIGDFWGIEKLDPAFDDNIGVSLVILNSEEGRRIFRETEGALDFKEFTKEQCLQPNLQHPTERPVDTDSFWENYGREGFESTVKRYCGFNTGNFWRNTLLRRAVRKIRRLLHTLLKGLRRS